MSKIIFNLDGKDVTASRDETIWQVAKREGTRIPHLCFLDEPGVSGRWQLPGLYGGN